MVNLFKEGRDIIVNHNSPEAYLAFVKSVNPQGNTDATWANGTMAQALNYLEFGSDKYLADANKLIEQMKDLSLFAHGQKLWSPSVVGAFPHVPNYIMGLPETMYALEETEIEAATTPLRIYIQLGADWRVDASHLVKRGLAVMAFALVMKQVRPIELHCVAASCPSSSATIIQTIRIETNPLDLERATFMLCDPAMYRQICFAMNYYHDKIPYWSTSLPFHWQRQYGDKDAEQTMREVLNLNPDDVYITGVAHGMQYEYQSPLAWVTKTMSQYGLTHETEH